MEHLETGIKFTRINEIHLFTAIWKVKLGKILRIREPYNLSLFTHIKEEITSSTFKMKLKAYFNSKQRLTAHLLQQ